MLRKQNINKYRKYEHIMENSHKTRFWIYLSISICLIATGVALGKVTNLTDSQVKQDLFLHELNLKYNELGNELNQAVRDIAVLKSSNLGLSDQVLDLFISTLPKNIQQKIDVNVQNTNVLSDDCTTKLVGQQISRTYYSSGRSNIPEYMVLSFPEGDLVIDRQGEVNCYKTPIKELNPKPVECSQICDVKEVEPISKVLPVIQDSKTA